MLGAACYQQIQIHQKPNIKKFDVGYFLRYVSMTYCFRVGRVEKNVEIRSRLVLLVGSASEGGYSLWLPQRSQIRLIHRRRAFRQKRELFWKGPKNWCSQSKAWSWVMKHSRPNISFKIDQAWSTQKWPRIRNWVLRSFFWNSQLATNFKSCHYVSLLHDPSGQVHTRVINFRAADFQSVR